MHLVGRPAFAARLSNLFSATESPTSGSLAIAYRAIWLSRTALATHVFFQD